MITVARSRAKVAALVNSWLGLNEADGSYKKIIDIYNSQSVLPRGTKMQYGWAWCAATWSAIAIKLGYTDIMPVEMSCSKLIEQAKKMNIWVETDGYIPNIGDACLYYWKDDKSNYATTDCIGAPDHIGTVTYVNKSSGYFVVTEGNYSNSVKKRTVDVNGRYIRGFICPRYDEEIVSSNTANSNETKLDLTTIAREVISGKWGTGLQRKSRLENAGYDYGVVQTEVNRILNGGAAQPLLSATSQIEPTAQKYAATTKPTFKKMTSKTTLKTTAALYLRNGAGTNKKALCLMPMGVEVRWYGYYSKANNQEWYYVQTDLNGTEYTGFCCSVYLK